MHMHTEAQYRFVIFEAAPFNNILVFMFGRSLLRRVKKYEYTCTDISALYEWITLLGYT